MEETDDFIPPSRESNEPPGLNEPICLVSYEVTSILLAGGPEERSGFWKAYRKELALNKKTDYRNYHIQICSPHLRSLRTKNDSPVFYRGKRLVTEKLVDPFAENQSPKRLN